MLCSQIRLSKILFLTLYGPPIVPDNRTRFIITHRGSRPGTAWGSHEGAADLLSAADLGGAGFTYAGGRPDPPR
jgi:hypothetical protein